MSSNSCSVLDSQRLPGSTDFLYNIDWNNAEAVIFWICLVLALITIAISIEGIIHLIRTIENYEMKVLSGWQMGLYGVFALTALISLLMPRSSAYVDQVASFYFAVCQYQLMNLFFGNYLNGDKRIVEKYGGNHVLDLRQMLPCTLCCKCLPQVRITRLNLWRIRMVVAHGPTLHALLLILFGVLESDGILSNYEVGFGGSAAITLILSYSKLTAMVGLAMANLVLPDEKRTIYKSKPKFIIMFPMMGASQMQAFVIKILSATRVISCNPEMGLNAGGRANYIQHVVLIFETTLLCIIARLIWQAPVPEPEESIDWDETPAPLKTNGTEHKVEPIDGTDNPAFDNMELGEVINDD